MKNRYLTLLSLIALLLAGTIFTLGVGRSRAHKLVHPERSYPQRTPDEFGIENWQSITLTTEDGLRLAAWYIPPRPETDGAAVIFAHGFGGNRANLLLQASMLVQRGYGALLFDFRNHGDSEGTITTLGLLEEKDVAAALEYVLAQPEANPDRIGLVGHSMGGATVLRAAARLPEIDAVVAESSYTSLEDNVVEGVRYIAHLPAFPFAPMIIYFGQKEAGLDITLVRPIEDVPLIAPRPILFIHGEADRLILPDNSRRLFAAANEPKELYLLPDVNHIGVLEQDTVDFEDHFVTFFDTYLLGK
ncbi:MAG: alpha/beta hydrolase [Anaerolineales bacterium]|nr:alpha/beta hydrolase [Anaerolineales bacterium]MCB8950946.1 alpha/beta hydrolase [Ardenticatenales bacterium]